jgi:hypothetical protein
VVVLQEYSDTLSDTGFRFVSATVAVSDRFHRRPPYE